MIINLQEGRATAFRQIGRRPKRQVDTRARRDTRSQPGACALGIAPAWPAQAPHVAVDKFSRSGERSVDVAASGSLRTCNRLEIAGSCGGQKPERVVSRSCAPKTEIVTMRREGLSFRSIATSLKIPVGTVASVLRRAGLTDPNSINAYRTSRNRRPDSLMADVVEASRDLSLAEAGRRYGVHQATVAKWRREAGMKPSAQHQKLTAEQVDEVRCAVACGETQAAVAARFGVHYSTVSLIVNRRRRG